MKRFSNIIIGASLSALLTIGISISISSIQRENVLLTNAAGEATVTIKDESKTIGFADGGKTGTFSTTVVTTDDLSIGYGGINGKSSETATTAYGYFMFVSGNGFMYSNSAISGYYPSKIDLTFTLKSAAAGKFGVIFSENINDTYNGDNATVIVNDGTTSYLGKTYSFTNNNTSYNHWQIVTSNKNVQITSIGLTYTSLDNGDIVTEMSVTPSTKSLYNTQTLDISEFTVSVTKNGAAGTSSDYVYQGIGTGVGDKFVARDPSFTSGKPLVKDTRLQWKAKYPTSTGSNNYLYCGVDLTVTADSITYINVLGNLKITTYPVTGTWSYSGLSIKTTSLGGVTNEITADKATWTFDPATPADMGVGQGQVKITADYQGITHTVQKNVTVTAVDNVNGTYDFVGNFPVYGNSWSTNYSNATLNEVDLNGPYPATVNLSYVNKSQNTITDRPVIGKSTGANNYVKVLEFNLNKTGYLLESVTVNFQQWTTKTPSFKLIRGTIYEDSSVLAETALSDTQLSISYPTVNSSAFSLMYCANKSEVVQVGLDSIVITIKQEKAFNVPDHMRIVSLPYKTSYLVGEPFSSEGFKAAVYDGVDEDTASYKLVNFNEGLEHLTDDGYVFQPGDVPGYDNLVEYTESGVTVSASFHITVSDQSAYQLVTTAPTDWSGNYIIADVNGDSTVVFDSSLTTLDASPNYVTIDPDLVDETTIITDKKYEVRIAKKDNGNYSLLTTSGLYFGQTAKDNGIKQSTTTAYDNQIELLADKKVRISKPAGEGETIYALDFNSSSSANRFRYYNVTETLDRTLKLYKLVTTKNVDTFVTNFLNYLNGVCEADGSTDISLLQYTWGLGYIEYQNLDGEERLTLQYAVSAGDSEMAQLMMKYDYICAKYGTKLEGEGCDNFDFLNRGIKPSSMNVINVINSSFNTIIPIALLLVSGLFVSGYISFRKRKLEK